VSLLRRRAAGFVHAGKVELLSPVVSERKTGLWLKVDFDICKHNVFHGGVLFLLT